jgi:hypothetical protein
MQYQSTVFAQLLKALPRGRFEQLARKHAAGRRKRELSAWGHFVAMVLAQACGVRSLRDLERLFERHSGIAAHLGLGQVKRSTLSDANRDRPAELFADVATLLAGLARTGRGKCEALHLIDATRIVAGKRIEAWAGSGAIKLHVMYEAHAAHPICFAVTSEHVNDITAAQAMPIEPGATYVFDKGYYHFAFWAKLDSLGCRFVTRLKKNSPTTVLAERMVTAGNNILFDRTVRLSQRLMSQRSNPIDRPVRMIAVRIDNGQVITLVSNDLDSAAEDIAALYKMRWQVELFFKWLKQNLKIAHFLGASHNAVSVQVISALIAFLLLRIAQIRAGAALSLQAIARLTQSMALARRPIEELFWPPPSPAKSDPPQLALSLRHA